MSAGLESRLAGTDPRLLVPDGVTAPDRLELRVAVPVANGGRLLALATDVWGGWWTLPLVDDPAGLRRARPGDGLAAGLLPMLSGRSTAPGALGRPGRYAVREFADREVAVAATGLGGDELVDVGDCRIRLAVQAAGPEVAERDLLGDLDRNGHGPLLPYVGDLVVDAGDAWHGPVARAVVVPRGGVSGPDRVVGLVADHLRGGEDAEPTLRFGERLGRLLADFHHGVAGSRGAGGTWHADSDTVARWRRAASDAVAEAVVLAEGEAAERLRTRRDAVRGALEALTAAEGSALLPGLSVPGLDAVVDVDGGVWVDPLLVDLNDPDPRSPVRDLARLLRDLDHVSRTVHRRLVGGGYPAPIERLESWSGAVREMVLDAYRQRLAERGAADVFEPSLLRPFEVELECRRLSHASRVMPTQTALVDAALADLLARPDR